jgi:hypothetical protein
MTMLNVNDLDHFFRPMDLDSDPARVRWQRWCGG